MNRRSQRFTKRRSVLGLPVGKRRTDWPKVIKTGMLGVGAVSTVMAGLGALLRKVRHQLGGLSRKVTEQLGRIAGQGGDQSEAPGDTGDGRAAQQSGASKKASPAKTQAKKAKTRDKRSSS